MFPVPCSITDGLSIRLPFLGSYSAFPQFLPLQTATSYSPKAAHPQATPAGLCFPTLSAHDLWEGHRPLSSSGSFSQSSAFIRGSILTVRDDPQALGFLKPSAPSSLSSTPLDTAL